MLNVVGSHRAEAMTEVATPERSATRRMSAYIRSVTLSSSWRDLAVSAHHERQAIVRATRAALDGHGAPSIARSPS